MLKNDDKFAVVDSPFGSEIAAYQPDFGFPQG